MQLATRQRRLEHVARIHRTFGFARTDHGVNFIDEEDDLAFLLGNLLEHGLQALLELAAVLGTGQQCGHVERKHLLAFQRLRHFTVDDALRQALDDRSLAHARLADQHRVVLGTTLQDLNGTADLVVTADHWVKLARARTLGQVEAVFCQRLALCLGILTADAGTTANGLDRSLERLAREPVLFHQTTGFTRVIAQCEQEHLAGDELVTPLLRFLVGEIEQVAEVAPDLHLATVAFHLGQPLQGFLQGSLERWHIDAGALQQRHRAAVFLAEHGQQQVLRLDELLIITQCDALGIVQGLLKFGRKLVEAHG